ncbi:hypothetical protein NHX12_000769 [Muraenolepis orangiensis]|uniref:Costars domain-containing protein n=1 Tax=Muraenolepis orangiensis TaxID=630683 RepID=A0A9Q0E0T8_9TELE|nr:hypothetical protein NHX12_000769 [Muraenolepis orangiensis]
MDEGEAGLPSASSPPLDSASAPPLASASSPPPASASSPPPAPASSPTLVSASSPPLAPASSPPPAPASSPPPALASSPPLPASASSPPPAPASSSPPPAPTSPPPCHVTDDRVTCIGRVGALKDSWQRWSSDHREAQKHNPFSQEQEGGRRPPPGLPRRGQRGYGTPPEGSVTERRAKDAHTHIRREVEELCSAIRTVGRSTGGGDGQGGGGDGGRPVVSVEFGTLFEHYVSVSNKLVGVLLRARKQGLVHFEGEMLWQGQDNRVVITLLQ